jgi:hypothetical protein
VAGSSGPGRGGVGRGRGDAPLDYGDETPGRTDQFAPQALPGAERLDIDSTGIIGVGATTPTVAPLAQGAGLVEVQLSTGKSAWKRRLAPHHREAVQEFFGGKKEDR